MKKGHPNYTLSGAKPGTTALTLEAAALSFYWRLLQPHCDPATQSDQNPSPATPPRRRASPLAPATALPLVSTRKRLRSAAHPTTLATSARKRHQSLPPPDEAPSDEAPSDKAPSDEAPSDKTPSDEAPPNKTPSNKTPSDKTPSDEAIVPVSPPRYKSSNPKRKIKKGDVRTRPSASRLCANTRSPFTTHAEQCLPSEAWQDPVTTAGTNV